MNSYQSLDVHPKQNNGWNDKGWFFLYVICAILSFILLGYDISTSNPDFTQLNRIIPYSTTIPSLYKFVPISLSIGVVFSYLLLFFLQNHTKFFVYVFSIIAPTILGIVVMVSSIFLYWVSLTYCIIGFLVGFFILMAPIIVYFSRSKLPLTIDLIKHSTKTLLQENTILGLLVPFFLLFSLLITFLLFYSLLAKFSSGVVVNESYEIPWTFYFSLLYQFFMCYWFTNALEGIFRVTTAAQISKRYLNIPTIGAAFPLSLMRSLTTSFGSICIGSLLLSTVQFLRLLESFCHGDGEDQSLLQAIFSFILQFILALLEEIIRYINRMAYATIGMYQTSFFESSKIAFNLLKGNVTAAILEDTLLDGVVFGFAIVTGGVAACGAVIILVIFGVSGAGLIAGGIIGFIIGVVISKFYCDALLTATDTLLLCYAEDMIHYNGEHSNQFNDVVGDYPQFGSINQNDEEVEAIVVHN
ncbi:Choline transporter-like protein [Entamoeba marina]